MGVRQDTTKKGTTVTNKYQKNTLKASAGQGLAVPDEVTVAMSEIADDMREGLLALAVGAGLQVMSSLMEADVARRAVRAASTTRSALRCATAVSAGRSPWVGVESRSNGRGCVPPAAVRCPCLPMTCLAAARSWAGWR